MADTEFAGPGEALGLMLEGVLGLERGQYRKARPWKRGEELRGYVGGYKPR